MAISERLATSSLVMGRIAGSLAGETDFLGLGIGGQQKCRAPWLELTHQQALSHDSDRMNKIENWFYDKSKCKGRGYVQKA
jgi:hypothetical protein